MVHKIYFGESKNYLWNFITIIKPKDLALRNDEHEYLMNVNICFKMGKHWRFESKIMN